jgi:carbon-monoxide dehydrogenase large subunit
MPAQRFQHLGNSVIIPFTKRYLTGRTSYVADVNVSNPLHCFFVRSPYAHARIRSISIENALRSTGVQAIITGKEIEEGTRPIWQDFPPPAKYKRLAQQWMPTDVVRHKGEAIALIVADTEANAEDAAELIEVEYEALPVVTDPESALEKDSVLLYPEWKSNLWVEWNLNAGDVDSVFSKADVVIKKKFRSPRQAGAPIEPGGTIAEYDPSTDKLTMWMSKQDPFAQRDWISQALGMAASKLRVISTDVGGGFGVKLNHYSEDIVIGYASMKLRRPLRWIMTRSEQFIAVHQSREMIHYVELAARRSGEIIGIRGRLLGNVGVAHKGQWFHSGPMTCLAGAGGLTGLYDIRNFKYDVQCVVTNTVPEGAIRGFGFQETNFVMERLVDILAREVNLDCIALRSVNLIKHLPHESVTKQVYDSGNYKLLLDTLIGSSHYSEWLTKKKRNNLNSKKKIGVGIALYAKGTAPITRYAGQIISHDMITVEVIEDGRVVIRSGSANIGTHHTIALAQIVSDEIGVDINDITFVCGDTDNTPLSLGPYGSRMAICAGNATAKASRQLKAKIQEIAGHVLEARPEDIELVDGLARVKGSPRKSGTVTLKDVARAAYVTLGDLPAGCDPGLSATASFEPPAIDIKSGNIYGGISVGAAITIVEVDSETGGIDILGCYHLHDSGKTLNPALVETQCIGGLAQGMGAALYEEILYDKNGQLVSGSFVDYLIPTSLDLPGSIYNIEVETPSQFNPMGVKGVGESAAIPPPASIANAVADAIFSGTDRSDELDSYPVTPELTWRLLKGIELRRISL